MTDEIVVAGVDLGLRTTGVGIISVPSFVADTFSIKPKSVLSVSGKQINTIAALYDVVSEASLIAYEDFAMGYRYGVSGRLIERVEMVGMLKFLAFELSKPIVSVPANIVKSFAGGRVSASKEDVRDSITSMLNTSVANFDESDALVVAAIVACSIDAFVLKTGRYLSMFDLSDKQLKILSKFVEKNSVVLSELVNCVELEKCVIH